MRVKEPFGGSTECAGHTRGTRSDLGGIHPRSGVVRPAAAGGAGHGRRPGHYAGSGRAAFGVGAARGRATWGGKRSAGDSSERNVQWRRTTQSLAGRRLRAWCAWAVWRSGPGCYRTRRYAMPEAACCSLFQPVHQMTNSLAGKALLMKYPCASSHDRSRSLLQISPFSTPSATTVRPRL
jgi:hypothetical protein